MMHFQSVLLSESQTTTSISILTVSFSSDLNYIAIYRQEPITQREGALNLCMYADSTCCQIALAQHSLYGKCYVSAIIYLALV